VELDVRIGGKTHVIKLPEYIADGLCNGTNEHCILALPGVAVTITYAGLVLAQFSLSISNDMSNLSLSLWVGATAAGIFADAWLGGIPRVCSGITYCR